MKAKINFKIGFFLGLILILFYSCEREGKVEEPLPFGPSSLTVLLNVSASLNVLTAGTTREVSTITATLKKYDSSSQTYNGQANKSITFEICDAAGSPVNIGYFEGNASVITAVTDANGTVTATYYGPLATEIATYTTVYIWATVAQQGKESISESAPINIIADITELTLSISGSPNVLNAGTTRESSTITATLNTTSGTPIVNLTIHFEICDANGNKVNIGYFTGNESVITQTTDANGAAAVTYYGPLAQEITENATVYIRAAVALEGTSSLSLSAPISIIREAIEKALAVSPNPNVINAGAARETSTITATLTTVSGDPVANKTIKFEICDAPLGNKINIGYFGANESVTTAVTNASGIATVTYFGPLSTEIVANMTVYIQATAFLEGAEFLYASAPINIILDARILTVSANPNVIVAGAVRQTSTITATLTTAGGVPMAAQTIHFEILDGPSGNKINIGYFTGVVEVATAVTDANGVATVTYFGPLAAEIADNTTIYIKAITASEGEEFIVEFAPIQILDND